MNTIFDFDYKVTDYLLKDPIPDLVEFREPLRIWNKARGNKIMPEWKDFSFENWVGWHASMCVTDILPEPTRQVEIIMGEFYRAQFGRISQLDISQYKFNIIEKENNFETEYREYAERQYNKGFICLFSGIIPKEGASLKKVKILDLPLTDEEGKRAVRILSFLTLD